MRKLIIIALLLFCSNAFAQTAYVITPPGNGQLYHPDLSYVQPGDTIKLQGDFQLINIQNLHGDSANHIIITNSGYVEVGGYTAYTWQIGNSSYFDIIGTPVTGYDYGLKINAAGTGVDLATPLSHDFTVQYAEITGGGIGIQTKDNPVCGDASTQNSNYYKNIKYLHLHIHDTGGEGIYYGYSGGENLTCGDSTMIPHWGSNVEVAYCLLERNGWDGIQLTDARNSTIHDNTVLDYGTANMASQQTGIQFGTASSGSIYNNTIKRGTGPGILSFGMGIVKVYNNSLDSSGITDSVTVGNSDGIYLATISGNSDSTHYYAYDNTVLHSARNAISVVDYIGKAGTPNYVYGNTISGYGGQALNVSGFSITLAYPPVIPPVPGKLYLFAPFYQADN